MEPYNLLEKLSMEQVKADPLNGATKLNQIRMTAPRWLAEDGWVKMQNVVKHSDGTSTNIHFVYNKNSGAFDDFKIKRNVKFIWIILF